MRKSLAAITAAGSVVMSRARFFSAVLAVGIASLAPAALAKANSSHGSGARRSSVGATTSRPSTNGGTLRRAGWITLGGGTLALVGSLTMFRLVAVKRAQSPFANGTGSVSDRNEYIRDHTTVGQVLLGAGVLGVGAGLGLVLWAPTERSTFRASVGLRYLSLGGAF